MRERPDDAGQRSGPGDDVTPGRWQQRAGFSVFFDLQPGVPGPLHRRTRVYHEETGDETTFPDGEPVDWVQWMLGRLESAQPEPAAAGGGRRW